MTENKEDVFYACSKAQLDKTVLVVTGKNQNSAYQNKRIFIVTPEKQNPHASEEAKKKLNDLKSICKEPYPKFSILMPPLQLRSGREKISGPGGPYKANSNQAPGEK